MDSQEIIWTFTPEAKASNNTHSSTTITSSRDNYSNSNNRSNNNNNNKRTRSTSYRQNSDYYSRQNNNNSNYYNNHHGSSKSNLDNQPFRSSRNNHYQNNYNNNKRNNNRSSSHHHDQYTTNSSSSQPTVIIPWRHARTLAREQYLLHASFEHTMEEDQNEIDDELITSLTSTTSTTSSTTNLSTTDPLTLINNLPKLPKHSNPLLQHYTHGYSSLPTKCALLRLHEEILDFATFVTPSPNETLIAQKALQRINIAILQCFPFAKIEIFGSRTSNLVLPTSDWDIAIFGVAGTSPNMYKLARDMEKNNLVSRTEVIATARVPIVKLWEKQSGIQIDISFEAKSALVSRTIIQTYLARYPAVRPLVLVLKYFLLQRGLNDTFTGGIGSFLLVLMVVHVVSLKLQEHEQQQKDIKRNKAGQSNPNSSSSTINLGMLLLSIFEYYGFNLNIQDIGISVLSSLITSPPSSSITNNDTSSSSSSWTNSSIDAVYYTKRARNWYDAGREYLLSIENPSDITIDAGKNSWGMERIRRSFRIAHVNLARIIRQYDQQYNNYTELNQQSTTSSTRSSLNNIQFTKPLPESILSSVIRIDTLLRERAVELFEQRETEQANNSTKKRKRTSDEEDEEGETSTEDNDSESTDEKEIISTSNNPLSSSSTVATVQTPNIPIPPQPLHSPEEVSRKVQEELETQAKTSGIVLRHSRLLADIMTRKERGVEALALQAPQYGTY